MSEQYPSPARPVDQQFVGIDLHRRRSVIVRMDAEGRQLGVMRIVNDVTALRTEVGKCSKQH